jgi:hypothetical protein
VGLLLVTRLIPGGSRHGNLSRAERVYLCSTPVPLLVAVLLPGLIAMQIMRTSGSPALQRWWSDRTLQAGLATSAALVIAGGVLLWRRWMDDRGVDSRLMYGLLLASVPLLLVILLAGFWFSLAR